MATLITRKGKEIFSGRMVGATPTQAEPKFLAWGLNPAGLTTTASDVSLYSESAEARTSGTSSIITTTTTNDTYQVTGTQTATGTRAIQEAGLLDSGTQPAQGTVAGGAGVIGSSSATALTTTATFTPGNNNYIQIRGETMQVTAGSGTTSLTVVRAQNGSTGITTIIATDNIAPGNPPGQTGVAGGSLFAKADLAPINLNSGDSITWTWQVNFV
jgi:hypothetical protein